MINIPRRILCLAFLTMSQLLPSTVLAQDAAAFPSKPIRFLFPWAAGSKVDSLVRTVAEGMAVRLKTPVVVDTRSGANGIIAAKALIDAPADGYTIMVGNEGSFGINTARPNPPYDARKDFAPITQLATTPLFLVVSNSSPYHSLRDMMNFAKSNPERISYGTIGIGSASHLAMEKLAVAASANMIHVPYKGSPETITNIIAGNINFAYTGGLSNVQNGRVRALAVGGASRYPGAPNIPTVKEQLGVDYDEAAWFGIVAPKGTPAVVIQKINAAIADTLSDPKLKEKYSALGFDIALSTPDELGTKISKSVDGSASIIRQAKIQFN